MRSESFSANSGKLAVSGESLFFPPKATIYCQGEPRFRSRSARDLGCLLDVDSHVVSWQCMPLTLEIEGCRHTPDFLVIYDTGRMALLDVSEDAEGATSLAEAAAVLGLEHAFVSRREIQEGPRLRNASDLLRYGSYRTPLGDRVRILALIDELGSIRIADALTVFREVAPMAGLASLILHRFLSVDLDADLIGPEMMVRRGER